MGDPFLHSEAVAPAYRAAVRRMAADYEAVFGGRAAELAALDAFLDDSARPFLFLHAPTGRGKTALLIAWLRQLRRTSWRALFLPISRRYETAGARATLGALAHSLAELHGEQIQDYTSSPAALRALAADYLRREPPEPLLIVIDAADEAVGWRLEGALFPADLHPAIKLIVSARELADTTEADWLAQLGWAAERTALLHLAPLSAADLGPLLPPQALDASPALAATLAQLSAGDPLTVRLLVEGLRAGELSPAELAQRPPGLRAHLDGWLSELRHQAADTPALALLLGLCALAHAPLSAADLAALAPELLADQDELRYAAGVAARFLIGSGAEGSGYVFSHPRLREVYAEQLLSEAERADLNGRFMAYGRRWYAAREGLPPDYIRQFWIAHLLAGDGYQLAAEVLTAIEPTPRGMRQPWSGVRLAVEGCYTGYLGDLELVWRAAEERQDLRIGLRCALISSSIAGLNKSLSADVLLSLLRDGTAQGRWTLGAALEYIRQMPGCAKIDALRGLLAAGYAIPEPLTLDLISMLRDPAEEERARWLLAPQLSAAQQEEIEAHERRKLAAISDPLLRIVTLTQKPHLATGPHSYPLLADLLREIQSIKGWSRRCNAFETLIPLLRPEHAPLIIPALKAQSPIFRRELLYQLAPLLPSPQYDSLYRLALQRARLHLDFIDSARALIQLAQRYSTPRRLRLYAEALREARQIADPTWRVALLSMIAPNLPEQHAAISRELLSAVQQLDSPLIQVQTLALHLAAIHPTVQHDAVQLMLDLMGTPGVYEHVIISSIDTILPLLSAPQREQARGIIEQIPNPVQRSRLLSGLSAYDEAPLEERQSLHEDALITAEAYGWRRSSWESFAFPLIALVPLAEQSEEMRNVVSSLLSQNRNASWNFTIQRLPPYLQEETFKIIFDQEDDTVCTSTMDNSVTISSIPLNLRPKVLARIRAIKDQKLQSFALVMLAPLLADDQAQQIYADLYAMVEQGMLTHTELSQFSIRIHWSITDAYNVVVRRSTTALCLPLLYLLLDRADGYFTSFLKKIVAIGGREERSKAYAAAIRVIERLPKDEQRGALLELIELAPESDRVMIYRKIESLATGHNDSPLLDRARAHLPDTERLALGEALIAKFWEQRTAGRRSVGLKDIVDTLPHNAYPQLLPLLEALIPEYQHISSNVRYTIIQLARHLPPELVPQLVSLARDLPYLNDYTEVLLEIAYYSGSTFATELRREVLSVLREHRPTGFADEHGWRHALEVVATYEPTLHQQVVLLARSLTNPELAAHVYRGLLPLLNAEDRDLLLEDLLGYIPQMDASSASYAIKDVLAYAHDPQQRLVAVIRAYPAEDQRYWLIGKFPVLLSTDMQVSLHALCANPEVTYGVDKRVYPFIPYLNAWTEEHGLWEARQLWQQSLRLLSSHKRSEWLTTLSALVAWVMTIDQEEDLPLYLMITLSEVFGCWP